MPLITQLSAVAEAGEVMHGNVLGPHHVISGFARVHQVILQENQHRPVTARSKRGGGADKKTGDKKRHHEETLFLEHSGTRESATSKRVEHPHRPAANGALHAAPSGEEEERE